MLRICCSSFHKGEKLFGEKAPFEDRDETHGFCTACFALELQKIGQEIIGEEEREDKDD